MSELRTFITNTEERIAWYKKQMSDIYRDPSWGHVDKNCEFMVWYKDHLREMSNQQQVSLKELREERRHENEGLNPPSFYVIKHKSDDDKVRELVAKIEKLGYTIEITKFM